ncbi:MAG: glycoside hydrolase family 43 protein [Thermoleophilaceae bacterium]
MSSAANSSQPPTASTGAAQGVGARSATVTGAVTPNGSSTSYLFEFGTSTGYGSKTAAQSAGAGTIPVTVSAVLSGLTPATVYHFRLIATHCDGCRAGTTEGADETFTTGYQNATYSSSAPDPFVLDNGGTHNDYWEFNTGDLFPMLHSSDLVNWTSVGTAMTARPSWVAQSGEWHPWAPNVVRTNSSCPNTSSGSCYVMYYVGLSASTWANCVGVATSTTVGGPFADQGPLGLSSGQLDAAGRPIGCGDNDGYGVIDPSLFIDPSGQAHLYVSEDFACPPSPSCTSANSSLRPTISVIPLTPDMRHASGSRVVLFSGQANSWEAYGTPAPTVEGPSMQLHNGTYYLLYSAGSWQGAYGMGYATSGSPTGPFVKAASNPIFTDTPDVRSPGGGDLVATGPHGGQWMVYHGRDSTTSNPRTLRIDPFSWRASSTSGAPDVPVISGPTSTPQPTRP